MLNVNALSFLLFTFYFHLSFVPRIVLLKSISDFDHGYVNKSGSTVIMIIM